MMFLSSVLLLAAAAPGISTTRGADSLVDDVSAGYSLMHISSVRVGNERRSPTFIRHRVDVQFGVGDFSFGAQLQRADRSPSTMAGVPETGLMLTLGYQRVLTNFLLLDSFARVAVTDTDNAQPLYSADTDLRFKLVLFDADGWGELGQAVFPSAYVGTIVNRFGRVQAVAGLGAWWKGFGLYATGLYALNGVADPLNPGADRAIAFASLQNAIVSFSASYDLDLPAHNRVRFEVRKNIPFKNAGNDWVFGLQFSHFFN